MRRFAIPRPVFFLPLAIVCLSDTALGQIPTLTITDANATVIATTASPAGTLNIAATAGTSPSQVLTVTPNPTGTTIHFQVNLNPQTGVPPPWLRVNNVTNGSFPVTTASGTFTVNIITAGLPAGVHQGSFGVWVSTTQTITITVNLTVSGSSVLSANPPGPLQFTAIQGSNTASPGFITVQINTTGAALNYTLTAATQVGNWLLLSHTMGTAGVTQFTVQTNPTGLALGTYNGTITAQSTTTADSVVIAVTITVTGTATLTISPANPPPFLFQIGGAPPAAQNLTISTSSASGVSFSVTTNANFVVPSPLSGFVTASSPATISVGVNTSGLGVGTYPATLTITPLGGTAQTVQLTLVISNNPLLSASPTTLTFTAPFAGAAPAAKTAQVTATGTGGAVGFTILSDQTWLFATADQNLAQPGTPATLTVTVNQGNMAVGTYTGTLTITPTSPPTYNVVIEVTMVVGLATQITAGPSRLLFSFQTTTTAPLPQNVQIRSTGQPVSFSMTTATTSCGTNWLPLPLTSQSTTPATLTVSVNAPGLPNGTCNGTITVTPASGDAIQIAVVVIVGPNPLLVVSQPEGFGFETVAAGGSLPTRTLSVRATDNSGVAFSVTSSTNWLLVSGGGTTPQILTVFINPSGLLPGQYGGQIVITSAAIPGGSFTIPVTLVVTSNVTVTVTPLTLTFTMAQGGPLPASQNITMTNPGGTPAPTFTASISQVCVDLLSITPTSGLASGTIAVSVLANSRSIGTHTCQVNLAFQNAATTSAVVNVSVTITSARALNVPSTPLTFNYQMTQPQPASQRITITATGGAVEFSVGTTSTPAGWLSTDTTTATVTPGTPRDVVVSVNTQGLPIGNYNGQITITAAGVLQTPVTIRVDLIITGVPPPQPLTVTSTASNLAGAISPGAIVTIKGNLLGPANPPSGVLFTVNAQGRVDSTLAGVRVLFDGIPGTPIYVSATQDNVTAPYEIAGRTNVNVVVEYQGVSSAPVNVRVIDAAPAIFTLNQQGFGQAAALNQNGTFNGPPGGNTIPAPVNSVVAIYATGGGQTNPPSSTGSVSPTNQLLRIPQFGTVSATVGGLQATVEFAGAAPGLVTGVIQFNIRIPTPPPGMSLSGNQQVIITINGVSSRTDVTIAIQ